MVDIEKGLHGQPFFPKSSAMQPEKLIIQAGSPWHI